MPVPASILQMLETNNINYELKAHLSRANTSSSSGPQACAVRSVVLQDNNGLVQVVLPTNRLLDLDAIERRYDRKLRSLADTEMQRLLDQHGVTTIPAFPEWQGITTIVDSSLVEYNTLWLETGDHEQMISLKKEDFCALIETTSIDAITAEPPKTPENTEGDSQQIIDSVKRFTQLRIKQRLEDTLDLPPLPETAQKIIQLRGNPDADISDLTAVVELDPSLAAQVVSWAASPYYSAPGKIKSVHDAIVRVLGFDMVLNLALGLSLGKTINNEVINDQQMKEYWKHAVCVAASVEGLVTSIPRDHRPAFGMSYLSGLLCNFGYLIMAEVFPPYFDTVNRYLCANPHVAQPAIERHVIGVSSCQISAWLLEYWNMPDEVITALRQQNNSAYCGEHAEYANLIYIAEQLLARKGFGNRAPAPIPTHLFESLHLEHETAEVTIENILESADDLDSIASQMSA